MAAAPLWQKSVRILNRVDLEEWVKDWCSDDRPWQRTRRELEVALLDQLTTNAPMREQYREWLSNLILPRHE